MSMPVRLYDSDEKNSPFHNDFSPSVEQSDQRKLAHKL